MEKQHMSSRRHISVFCQQKNFTRRQDSISIFGNADAPVPLLAFMQIRLFIISQSR